MWFPTVRTVTDCGGALGAIKNGTNKKKGHGEMYTIGVKITNLKLWTCRELLKDLLFQVQNDVWLSMYLKGNQLHRFGRMSRFAEVQNRCLDKTLIVK